MRRYMKTKYANTYKLAAVAATVAVRFRNAKFSATIWLQFITFKMEDFYNNWIQKGLSEADGSAGSTNL